MKKRIIAMLMVVITLLSTVGDIGPVFATENEALAYDDESAKKEEEQPSLVPPPNGYLDIERDVPRISDEDYYNKIYKDKFGLSLDQVVNIPSSYSSVEAGYVTPIKNQNPWGTCWAFAATAAMESYVLSHGLADKVDFSEYALAYLTFSDDMYADQTGDYTYSEDLDVGFNGGGNDEYVFKALSKWSGIYNEGDDTYYEDSKLHSTNQSKDNERLPAYDTSSTSDFVFTGQYYIDINDSEQVKAAVIENGAVTVSYFAHDSYATDYKQTYNYNYEYPATNHAVAIVGWDDNKSKDLFKITDSNGVEHVPKNDGAWLIKNSWGTYWGDNGYIWISYEDVGLLSSDVVIYEVMPRTMFDQIYQHDGATVFYTGLYGQKFASVYEIEGDNQQINAVSIALSGETNVDFTVNIYKNTDGNALSSGTLVTTQKASTTYEGYYTVLLDNPVDVQDGETYTVEFIFDNLVGVITGYNGTELGAGEEGITVSTAEEGQSYWAYYETYDYKDLSVEYPYYQNFAIKMFTKSIGTTHKVPQITDLYISGRDTATIKWQTFENAQSYELMFCTDYAGTPGTLYQCGNVNSYTFTINYGEVYYFKVRAVYGEGEYSDFSVVKKLSAEIPSVDLYGTLEDTAVTLEWETLPYVDGYKIYRSVNNGEYTLYKDMELATSFVDSGLEIGSTYKYYVVSYIEKEETQYLSVMSNVISAVIPVPYVDSVDINDNFYGKMKLYWTMSSKDAIDGYYLIVYDEVHNVLEEVEITDVNTDSYIYDTSELNAGDEILFYIFTYVDNGEEGKAYSDISFTWGEVKGEPLQASVKWQVENGSLVLHIHEFTQDGYKVYYYSDLGNDYYDYRWEFYKNNISDVGETNTYYVPYNEEGYVYITDASKEKAYQEMPFLIGGAYKPVVLNKINDVSLTSEGQKVQLKAVIQDVMTNFNYQYQWYVSDSPTGEGVAITGATSSTYEATVDSYESKYFYCEVTVVYDTVYKTRTSNEQGKYTCIYGVSYGEVPEKITSSSVKVNDNTGSISKITVGTSVESFKSQLNEAEYVEIYKDNQVVSNSTILATGMKVCIMDNGQIKSSYEVIVTGDTNGDGKINITDMIAVKAAVLKKSNLSGCYEKAGDTNGDGKINITDFIKAKAHILKKDTIVGVAAN